MEVGYLVSQLRLFVVSIGVEIGRNGEYMKYAEEIIKEIENRETINIDDYLIDKDDAWEDYIRGKGSMPKEKHKPSEIEDKNDSR